MTFEAYIQSLGLDMKALSPAAIAELEATWRMKHKPDVPPNGKPPASLPSPQKPQGNPVQAQAATSQPESLDDIVEKTRADQERRSGILGLVKTYLAKAPERISDLEAVARIAIDGGWSVKETEFQMLKSCYPSGPMSYMPSASGPAVSQQVLEAAVCRAAGLSRETVEASYDDQTLSAADKHFRGGCGLQRLLTFAAHAHGARDAHVSSPKSLLKAAFAADDGILAATSFGPSTYSVSGILSNVANKFIRDSFNAVESTWRRISAVRPVTDFKQITSYALTGDMTYEEVGKGGEVKHGTFGETSYTNQAKLYGLMLGIDYRDLRNDDLGAFSKLNKRLGRGGALKINDVFWAAFLAGQGSFWAAANGNYYAHADYAFTLAKLANANVAWMIRTDPNGKPMADEALFLLVPPGLDTPAREYMSSMRISNDSGEGENNALAGKWTPLTSVYLQNSTISGYSPTNYFLVADPASDTPAIETVFLDGQEMPLVETAEPDLGRMGIMIRGTHAFGVNKQEPRGAIKFKQTAD
jgi:hypothetical protein